ncbi:MAG: type II toxin-antitoxin system VapC family toxin [Gammaproteobacteria bacterium]|nr:type II toxin-antitoxin system VapC family toxin [Gammaproteobacteria bacterium]MDE0715726.1 type II toxin-antitoxin system VapC family toxin [Gammaproteobacteria bacterium]MXX15915.1 type II toxin-antitoxin system VapC family toxin [Gammaproteobacteria bacterium]MXY64317.1 type II toxin-antitoxin system VapC family toxin [Gammaproteobacteria bacterium]MYG67782.1 type II toxin-antitoxin system VapC family toxin [Gammaproteobacteria bacterium]
MRLLLDTHILLWALNDDPRLVAPAREALHDAQERIVSAATIWEISIKRALGKLRVEGNPIQHALDAGCVPLSVTWSHGEAAGSLPPHHADPFDRLLIAQAQIEGMTILTADPFFRQYDVSIA